MGLFEAKPEPEPETKKKTPDLSGDIQIVEEGADGIKTYTLAAKIALWENTTRTGKQPHYTGIISPPKDMVGDSYKVSVWRRKGGAA